MHAEVAVHQISKGEGTVFNESDNPYATLRPVHGGSQLSQFTLFLRKRPRGSVSISASCIFRSLEAYPESLTVESLPAEANLTLTCFFSVGLRIPVIPELYDDSYAVLFEAFDLGYSPRRRISWVIFPILADLKDQYRLSMNSAEKIQESDVLSQLRNGRFRKTECGIFIQFNVNALLESNQCDAPGEGFPDPAYNDQSMDTYINNRFPIHLPTSVLRKIEIRGSDIVHLMKWSLDYQLLALVTPAWVFIYSVPDAELSARLELESYPDSIEWSGGTVLISCGAQGITIWNILSGEISHLALHHKVESLVKLSESDDIIAFGEGMLTVVSLGDVAAEFSVEIPDQILATYLVDSTMLMVYTAVHGIFKATQAEKSWSCSQTTDWSGPIEFASKACFADAKGGIFKLDVDECTYRQILQSPLKLTALSISETSKWLVVGTIDGRIHIHETVNDTLLFTSSVFFPIPVRLVEWSAEDRILSICATPEDGSTLPVILLSSPGTLPRMSKSMSDWAQEWSSRVSPGLNVIGDVSDMKRNILKLILNRPPS